MPSPRREWVQAWRDLAALTVEIESQADPRFDLVMVALEACDRAFGRDDWPDFQAAARRVRDVMQRVEAQAVHGKPFRTHGTGETEWYTPAPFLERARQVLGEIDLDPASSEAAQRTVQATRFYTKEDDGLSQDWHGRVWLNPPYAKKIIPYFVRKLIAEYEAGHVTAAILLTHNYTDTTWFQDATAAAQALCFPRGRIRFAAPDGTLARPTQGQAFFYFGKEIKSFLASFGMLGEARSILRAIAHMPDGFNARGAPPDRTPADGALVPAG